MVKVLVSGVIQDGDLASKNTGTIEIETDDVTSIYIAKKEAGKRKKQDAVTFSFQADAPAVVCKKKDSNQFLKKLENDFSGAQQDTVHVIQAGFEMNQGGGCFPRIKPSTLRQFLGS